MTSSETRTARRAFNCSDCRRQVMAGEEYARHVAFPGDDVNSGTRPWVLRLCSACQTKYGRQMPPRRSKARAA